MRITQIRPEEGARREAKRSARGTSGWHGKTHGRGQKGQKSRGSNKIRAGFQGTGPIYRQLPALRGRSNRAHNIGIFRKQMAVVNVGRLEEAFEAGAEVTPEAVQQLRLVSKIGDGLKVLGEGELTKSLTVRAHSFSASAREKIEKAGGTAEVIEQ